MEKIEKDEYGVIDAQNRAIKKRLKAHLNARQQNRAPSEPALTYQYLAAVLSDKYRFEIPWATLRSVFTVSNETPEPKPNLNVVLALCSYWKLDISEIFAPPKKGEVPSVSPTTLPPKDIPLFPLDAVPLSDEGYHDTFWGYMCSRSCNSKGIAYFKLSIGETADLEVFDPVSNGALNKIPTKYTGTPVLLKKAQKVYIVFSNAEIHQKDTVDGSRFYIFCFNYSHYRGGLYYCKGIVMTEDSKNQDLLAENFVLFKNPSKIDITKSEDQETIRGLLSFVDDEIYVSEVALEKLSESGQLRKFIKEYEYNWLAHPSQGYYLKIDQVLGAVSKNNREELYSAIDSLLKIISGIETSTRHSYKDIDKLRIFVKEYLQEL